MKARTVVGRGARGARYVTPDLSYEGGREGVGEVRKAKYARAYTGRWSEEKK